MIRKNAALRQKELIMLAITKENYNELVASSDRPVLIDFWATWCGPCRMIAPIVEEIAAEREDILVGKVDVDNEPELAKSFRIVSIPTLILVKDGKETARVMGYRPKADILKKLGL